MTEQIETECCINEQKNTHQTHDIGNLRQDIHDRINEEANGNWSLHKSEYSQDSEAANDGSHGAEGSIKLGKFHDKAKVSAHDDEAVKEIPTLAEVVFTLR